MPVDWLPPPAIVHVYRADAPSPNAAEGQPQPPQPIPQIDLAVEVVGDLPFRTRIQDVTRLLGQRQRASRTRRYPPTILELITLVKRRPARPPGRRWESITALTIGYDAPTRHVIGRVLPRELRARSEDACAASQAPDGVVPRAGRERRQPHQQEARQPAEVCRTPNDSQIAEFSLAT